MRNKGVLMGMSGGTDSTMAAILLKEKGYDVVGVTFKLWDDENEIETFTSIRKIADRIGVLHEVIDISNEFKKTIIDYFIKEYLAGRTPSACIRCNKLIKWKFLLEKAKEFGCSYISTGHYVNIVYNRGFYYVEKGNDVIKDQSYYLWALDQGTLSRAITPLGMYKKYQVKKMATERGFNYLSGKKESMGVCFLKGKDYRDFLRENVKDIQEKVKNGMVTNINGEVIGNHKGYPYYTVGQKRGIHLIEATCTELSVSKIDPKTNIVIMDQTELLNKKEFNIIGFYFVNPNDMQLPKISVKIRGIGSNPEGFCKIEKVNNDQLKVSLENQAWAIAPGQPVVFYKDNRVIGGGYIN